MKGYLKMAAADYASWNAQATADYAEITRDSTGASYTFATPDSDPAFVWARVEDDFIEGDIKTREAAIAAGMVISEE
jgi:hypothetical protein